MNVSLWSALNVCNECLSHPESRVPSAECPICQLAGGFHDTTDKSPHKHLRPVREAHVPRVLEEKLCSCGQFLSSIGAPTCKNPNHVDERVQKT